MTQAVQQLVRAAAVYDEQGMRDSVRRLTRIGAACLPVLRPLMHHEDANVRWQTLIVVGRIGEPDAPWLGPLLQAMQDADADVRGEAVSAAAGLFPGNRRVRVMIVALQNDAHPVVRVRAYAADWMLRQPKRSVTALIGLLQDRDWMAARMAEHSLVNIGPPAVPGLVAVLEHGDARHRESAVRILGYLSQVPTDVLQRIHELAAVPEPGLADAAMEALARSGRPGWLILKNLAGSQHPDVRTRAFRAAADVSAWQVDLLPVLNAGLDDRVPRVRLAAMATLRRLQIGNRKSLERLSPLLQSPTADHRAAAVAAIGGLGRLSGTALTRLRDMSRDDPVDYIRRHARQIVEQSTAANGFVSDP